MSTIWIFSIILFLFALLEVRSDSRKVSCVDEQGVYVDWWYMYKLPRGPRYMYVTSRSFDDWQTSEHRMGAARSLPVQTLDPLYGNPEILLAAYNDELPNGTTFDRGGYAKGVIAWSGLTGLWLVHSLPRYPNIPEMGQEPPDLKVAHNLLCLSLDAANMEKVGQLLLLYEPHLYYIRNPLRGTSELFPSLQQALTLNWRREFPIHEVDMDINTLKDKHFRIFGKSPLSNKDLFAELVGPALHVKLFVATDRNTKLENIAPNACRRSHIFNVKDIVYPKGEVYSTSEDDASKWAVSQATGLKIFRWRIGATDWICVSDLNRWRSHQHRGGGCICQKSTRVSDLYRKLIYRYEQCE